jgi:hypothetical protein
MPKVSEMSSADKFRLVSTIILFGFILAVFFHAILAFFQLGFPFNTFLFQPWDRFKDFLILYDISKDLNPYAHITNYFPIAYLLFYPFTWITNPNMSLLIYLDGFCCFMCWYANYYLKAIASSFHSSDYFKNLVILCFLSYPTLFCLDRANLDAMLFVFIAIFIISFMKKYYVLAAFLLALAIGMKVYPAVFLLLFVKEKQYKAVIYCIVFTLLLSLLALYAFKTPIVTSLSLFGHLSNKVIQYYTIQDGALTSSISLFTLSKVLLKYFYLLKAGGFDDHAYRNGIVMMLPYYIWLSIGIGGLVSLYILFVENVFWKQVMLLISIMALLPIISGDYRLIFMYVPLLLFLVNPQYDKLDYVYTVLFGLLFIPKNFFVLPHTLFYAFVCTPNGPCGNTAIGDYSVMSLLNISILVMFSGLIIYSGLQSFLRGRESIR